MSQTKVPHDPIVNYRGSLRDYHGFWHVESTGERLTLRDAYGQRLTRVRHTSVTIVEVPPLTPTRADALRMLAARPGTRINTRARNWLMANHLIEQDTETDEYRVTALGLELASALPRWY